MNTNSKVKNVVLLTNGKKLKCTVEKNEITIPITSIPATGLAQTFDVELTK